jgi:glycosyltransferase involved in cell wall biosynthesis
VNRSELGLSEQKYYLIAVGRLVRRKGFEYLIESLQDLPSEIQLLIIGDGPLEQELRNVAMRAGISDRVSLLGYQTRERIWEYLQVSDCYVLSSLHEGLGIVVQEAMCAGLPIVSSDNGGQVDLIHDGRNGVLVRPMDPHALSSAIKEIYSHPEMAAEMRRNNMNDIKRCYIADNCEEYIKLFHLGARSASS